MKTSDIEAILERPISDDLKLKIITIAESQQAARDSAVLEKKRWWWSTPMAVALTGLITLSGNFVFDYLRGNATTQNTVTLGQMNAAIELAAKSQETELSIRSEDKKFQFELIRTELARPDTSEIDRAKALLLLAKSGILDDLNVEALTELATDTIKAVDPTAGPSVPVLTDTSVPAVPLDLTPQSLAQAYAQLQLDPTRLDEIGRVAASVIANKARYVEVASATHIPWAVVGTLHQLEWGGDFSVHLNGDPLTDRTVQVPKSMPPEGDPPFRWEDSAKFFLANWAGTPAEIGAVLDRLERYNGLGYRRRGVYSPFLWACSTLYTGGRYGTDGRFDATATARTCGAASILRYMETEKGVDILAEQ